MQKKGLTLVETLIAVTITAAMGIVIVSTFLAGQSYYSHEKNRVRNEAEAMEAITLMEKVIRVAKDFIIYDNKIDMNPVVSGTCIELLDIKGTDASADDETIYFWLDGNTCYYESHYPSGVPYGTKTRQLAKHFNSLAFSQDGVLVKIDFQIDVPRGTINYSTSVKMRN